MENGKFVLTERYHLRRGHCCGNGCRHCPFAHIAVPRSVRSKTPDPFPYFEDAFAIPKDEHFEDPTD